MAKKILYIQYTNPTAYPPLEHGSRILADDQWTVQFIGTRSRGDSNALQFPEHANIHLRLMDYCHPGWRQKIHYVRYALWCLGTSLTFRPQIIYASDAWSYPIAYALSFLPGVQVVLHEHDTPSVSGSRVNRLIGACRRRLSQRALVCICPQAERARKMQSELQPKRMQVVFNCPSLDERPSLNHKPQHELGLWFHGSIVPTQLPLAVVDALSQCPFPLRLSFAGYETIGHPNYIQELLTRADGLGLAGRVQYVGAIPTRAEMYDKASRNHVGLALFAMNFREPMVGASNKPFDYLACGLALLASATPEWQSFFFDRGCGIGCNSEDPASIAQALTVLWTERQQLESFVSSGQALLASEWNYEAQFEPVKQLLNERVA